METRFVSNNQEKCWNSFIIENKGSFLQCLEWAKFQQSLGNKVFLLQASQENRTVAQALVIKHKFPLGFKGYFYIPYGPCLKKGLPSEQTEKVCDLMLKKLQGLAKKEGAVFLHIEPPSFLKIGFESQKRIQPQKTLFLDISRTEQEIFQNFPKDTRYSIRTAQKRGVSVKFSAEYSSHFYELLKKNVAQNNFKPFGEAHYQKLFSVLSKDFQMKMSIADYQGKTVAAAILVVLGKKAVYLHAASDREYSAFQAPSLLLWEQIKLAKSLGCELFDFWGIDEKKWSGVTHFKKSFGGREVKYPQGKDIVLQKNWYKLYRFLRNKAH